MYSNSSSFLGGGNSQRGPFGQQQPSSFPSGQQQQQYGGQQQPLHNQYTGMPPPQQQFGQQNQSYGQQPLQQQFTGYPGQQSQQTGYGQQPQGQSNSFQQPQPTGFQQPQQTGYQQSAPYQAPQQTAFQQPSYQAPQQSQPQPPSQPTAEALRPQMTSAQMADSFRGISSQQPPLPPKPAGSKIPNIRLSFITAQDQAKFEQLFKSAAGTGQALSGEQARDILLRSKLGGSELGAIWYVQRTKFNCSKLTVCKATRRYNQIWTTLVSRIRPRHVSLQPGHERQGSPKFTSRKSKERGVEYGRHHIIWHCR